MLTPEQNQRFTQVGPGTPAGELMRRYWHPVAATAQLEEPVRKVRLLGEDLVLYRDRSGNLGLIEEACPHRRVSMEYGIPEPEGIRCPYHGWLFNHEGRCLEQPAEPLPPSLTLPRKGGEDSEEGLPHKGGEEKVAFKDRVRTRAYPVQEFAGLIWAYLGPQPAPLTPRYDLFVWDNVVRQISATLVPCNWLQAQENSVDPVHVEWLHGYYFNYVLQRRGPEHFERFGQRYRHHKKIGFVRFDHGIIKRRVVEGDTEEDDPWRVGHPVVFPNILRVGNGRGVHAFQIRVPVDDTHIWHIWYTVYRPGVPVPPQEAIPFYEVPLYDHEGRIINDHVDGQDMLSWVAPGPIADRENEHLGQSDAGIIMFRQMLEEQLEKVARGEDPMEVYRDPALNQCILLPQEREQGGVLTIPLPGDYQNQARYSPHLDGVRALFDEAVHRRSADQPLLRFDAPPAIGSKRLPRGAHREVHLQP